MPSDKPPEEKPDLPEEEKPKVKSPVYSPLGRYYIPPDMTPDDVRDWRYYLSIVGEGEEMQSRWTF